MEEVRQKEAASLGMNLDMSYSLTALFRGPVFKNSGKSDSAQKWRILKKHQSTIEEYVAVLGLSMVLSDDDGYAFLRLKDPSKHENLRGESCMIDTIAITYRICIILVILREIAAEADASGDTNLMHIKLEDIIERVHLYSSDGVEPDDSKFIDSINRQMNKVEIMGFIHKVSGNKWKIVPIIKSVVDIHWLAKFDNLLQNKKESQDTQRTRVNFDTNSH